MEHPDRDVAGRGGGAASGGTVDVVERVRHSYNLRRQLVAAATPGTQGAGSVQGSLQGREQGALQDFVQGRN